MPQESSRGTGNAARWSTRSSASAISGSTRSSGNCDAATNLSTRRCAFTHACGISSSTASARSSGRADRSRPAARQRFRHAAFPAHPPRAPSRRRQRRSASHDPHDRRFRLPLGCDDDRGDYRHSGERGKSERERGNGERDRGGAACRAAGCRAFNERRARTTTTAIAAILVVACVFIAMYARYRVEPTASRHTNGAPAALHVAVRPLDVGSGPDVAWVRLGGMDLVADRLRRAQLCCRAKRRSACWRDALAGLRDLYVFNGGDWSRTRRSSCIRLRISQEARARKRYGTRHGASAHDAAYDSIPSTNTSRTATAAHRSFHKRPGTRARTAAPACVEVGCPLTGMSRDWGFKRAN
jgi:hypothetical protein